MTETWRQSVVLASASPRRLALLQQIGIEPSLVLPTSIDEEPKKGELPRALAQRLAREKALAARDALKGQADHDGSFIISADTVVAVGRRILPKADLLDEASACLRLLSGRQHRVYTGLCIITPKGGLRERMVESRVRLKRLSRDEFEGYLASGEWRGKAGGYAIQGLAGAFVVKLIGSYSAVVGLPLYETLTILGGEGFPVQLAWVARG